MRYQNRIFEFGSRPSDKADLDKTIEKLAYHLRKIRLLKHSSGVEVAYRVKNYPPGLSPLVSAERLRELGCRVIGLEVKPVFRDTVTGEVFPVSLRIFHRQLSRVFKQAFFQFSCEHTTNCPTNFHALGRQAMVKAVWEIDKKLAAISSAFDFLLLVSPVNMNAAWYEFKKSRYERMPVFYYRPLPIEPGRQKRKLYEIPIDRTEDPTLAALFREKRRELDDQISMLTNRGTRDFMYGSLMVYGAVSNELKETATTLLNKLPRRSGSANGQLMAIDFAKRAQAEVNYYRRFYPEMNAVVAIRRDVAGLMVLPAEIY